MSVIGGAIAVGLTGIAHSIQNILSTTSDPNAVLSKSMVEYSQVSSVEPVCYIEKSLVNHEITPAIQKTMLSLFSAYYLQCVGLMATINNVSIRNDLEKINPNRKPATLLSTRLISLFGLESIEQDPPKLPAMVPSNMVYRLAMESLDHRISLEANNSNNNNGNNGSNQPNQSNQPKANAKKAPFTLQINNNIQKDKSDKPKVETNLRDAIKSLTDEANLSIGRVLDVTVTRDGVAATVPVKIRMNTVSWDTETIRSFLYSDVQDWSMSARWSKYRMGELSFLDMVLCRDILKEYRKDLYRTSAKGNFLYENVVRRRNNKLASVITGNASLNQLSQIMIVSRSSIDHLHSVSGNDLMTDFNFRERIFDKNSLMLMAVVDTDRDVVTFFTQSIREGNMVSFLGLKTSKSKGDNIDIFSVLSALQQNRPPVF